MHCDKYAASFVPIDYLTRVGKSKIAPWDAGSFFILILRTVMLFGPLWVFSRLFCWRYRSADKKMRIDLSHQPNISASAQLALMTALFLLLIAMLGARSPRGWGGLIPIRSLAFRRTTLFRLKTQRVRAKNSKKEPKHTTNAHPDANRTVRAVTLMVLGFVANQ